MLTFPVSADVELVWSPDDAGYFLRKLTKGQPANESNQIFHSRREAVTAMNAGLIEWEDCRND